MKKQKDYFTNTRKNKHLHDTLLFFLFIFVMEYIVAVILLWLLIANKPAVMIFVLILTVLEIGLLFPYLISLLRSRHVLCAEEIQLHLGKRFSTAIALENITQAEIVINPQLPKKDGLHLILCRDGDTLYCLGNDRHVFCLSLQKPVLVKTPALKNHQSKKGYVQKIFLNVDEKEAFLAFSPKKGTPVAEQKKPTPQSTPNMAFPLHNIASSQHKPILELKELTCRYNDHIAVNKLNLQVYPGEIFGFLGANGAGKSTTLKMITGLLRPNSGQVFIQGQDIWKEENAPLRKKIGYVPDQPIVYWRLTAREHLLYTGGLYGIEKVRLEKKIEELLAIFELADFQHEMIQNYSQGMQRKVSLALALLNDPEVLIIDEFTNAYDTVTIARIKQICYDLKSKGKTIFFSGHVMSVAEEISDRISILRKGELVTCGTLKEICSVGNEQISLEELFLDLANRDPAILQKGELP